MVAVALPKEGLITSPLAGSSQSFQDVVADTQGVGDDG